LGHVARMGEMKNTFKILVGKLEGKEPLGRHKRVCEDNIRMDLRETLREMWTGYVWLRIGTSSRLL